jgi:hypothetical protein
MVILTAEISFISLMTVYKILLKKKMRWKKSMHLKVFCHIYAYFINIIYKFD